MSTLAPDNLDLLTLRTMTAMVIQGAETDLAQLLRARGEDVEEKIKEFLINRTKSKHTEAIDDPIGEVYWLDLWNFAAETELLPDRKQQLVELVGYAADVTIRKARNAASHANKPFSKHYWYSIAAFASKPEVAALGLTSMQEQLKRAETGDLLANVELDVMDRYALFCPNNLPEADWTKTGFVGRSKERKNLENEILNGRNNNICVSGPGGVGKTALVFFVLERLLSEQIFSGVFFYSFKTEELTAKGVRVNRSEQTLRPAQEGLQNFLNENFQLEKEQPRNVCLFLDNIENLLGEDDEVFQNFLNGVPRDWTVVCTSRLLPNGFKLVQVDDLDHQACCSVGHKYTALQGGADAARQFDAMKDRVVERCLQNPLAIKLTIDLARESLDFLRCAEDAIAMVTDYSFRNLSEHFDARTLKVMEFLRQSGPSSAEDISAVLQENFEAILESVNRIRFTSMLTVHPDEDGQMIYQCSDLTSNFLVGNHKIQDIKTEIEQAIRSNTNAHSRIHDKNFQLFRRSDHIFAIPEGPYGCNFIGRALGKRKSVEITPFNPEPHYVWRGIQGGPRRVELNPR